MSNVLKKTIFSVVIGVGIGSVVHSYFKSPSLAQYLQNALLMASEAKNSEVLAQASLNPSIEPPLTLVFLPKIEFGELAPLPRLDNESVQMMTYSTSSAQPEVDKSPLPKKVVSGGEWVLPELDLSSLSPELASRVANVLDKPSSYTDEGEEGELQSNQQIVELEQFGQRFAGRLPALNLQTHMYASSPEHRWVKINGIEIQEGMVFEGEIKLLEIAPRYILVEYFGETIKIPALYDWNG